MKINKEDIKDFIKDTKFEDLEEIKLELSKRLRSPNNKKSQ